MKNLKSRKYVHLLQFYYEVTLITEVLNIFTAIESDYT